MSNKFALCCNSCLNSVDGIAYRTRCAHLFCPTCAKATFQRSNICSVCSLQQRDIDVNEIKNTYWENIEDKLNKLNEESRATANFVVTQLIIGASTNAREKNKLELELGAQADQLAQLNQKVIQCEHNKESTILAYETQLHDANKAIVELQEAYKEKLRKCQAWEKAYNNIRGHLVGTNKSELSISSRDAAMMESEAMQRTSNASSGVPHDQFLQDHARKHLRTDVTTYRNVTTHRLQGGGHRTAFSTPFVSHNVGSTFLGNSGTDTGLFESASGRPHSLSPLPATAGSGFSEYHPRQQPRQVLESHSASRAPASEGESAVARYAPAPAQSHFSVASAFGKRSFFDGEN